MNIAGLSLSLIGLAFIVIAWAYQFASASKKKDTGKMHREFLLLYAVGTLLLAIDGYLSSALDLAIMNLIVFFLAGMMLFKDQ